MSHRLDCYLQLRQDAAEKLVGRNDREAETAQRVALQSWRGLSPGERRQANRTPVKPAEKITPAA
jgi:hypothetical protein